MERGSDKNKILHSDYSRKAHYAPPTPTRLSLPQLSRVSRVNAPVGCRDPVYNFLCHSQSQVKSVTAIEPGDK